MDDGTVLVKGDYNHSGIYIDGPYSKILIKNNAHVEAPTIVGNTYYPGQKLVVTGGTLTYDYSKANTLWPENEQGNKLTNFLLTKDADHADFGAFAYNGTKYEYVSDLNKEKGKQYLSVWVPAAALEYMLDVDGSQTRRSSASCWLTCGPTVTSSTPRTRPATACSSCGIWW